MFSQTIVQVQEIESALLHKNDYTFADRATYLALFDFYDTELEKKGGEYQLSPDELQKLATILTQDPKFHEYDAANKTACHRMLMSLRNVFGIKALQAFKEKQLQESKGAAPEIKKEPAKLLPVRKINFPPYQVDINDLDEQGRLKVTFVDEKEDIRPHIRKYVLKLIAEGKKEGRISKKEFAKILKVELNLAEEKKPTCGVTYYVDENGIPQIYWVYKGQQHRCVDRIYELFEELKQLGKISSNKRAKYLETGRLLGGGSCGSAKILQHDESDDWTVLKIKRPKNKNGVYEELQNDDEAEVGKDFQFVKHRSVRTSFSKKVKQEEIILKRVPGDELFWLLQLRVLRQFQLTPLFWLEVISNIFKVMIDLENRKYIHRDIKPENLMIFAVTLGVGVIDHGFTRYIGDEKICNDGLKGTPCYLDVSALDMRTRDLKMTPKFDYYAAGVVIAECLDRVVMRDEANNNLGQAVIQSAETPYLPGHRKIVDNKDQLQECLNRIKRLMGPVNKRPKDLKENAEFFQKLFEAKREISTVKACLISVNEFLAGDKSKRDYLVKQARQFNQFYFVEFNNVQDQFSQKKLIEAYKAFEFDFLYQDQVVCLERKDLKYLRSHLAIATNQRHPKKKFEFHFVTQEIFSEEERGALAKSGINYKAPQKDVHQVQAGMFGQSKANGGVAKVPAPPKGGVAPSL